MANLNPNKYELKSIHAEIDLFDRKLAHAAKHGEYATEQERAAAVRKLTLKRDQLTETARKMVAQGIEFDQTDLPRSQRPKDAPKAEVEALAVVAQEPQWTSPVASKTYKQPSPFAGTSLDWQQSVQHYLQKKGRA